MSANRTPNTIFVREAHDDEMSIVSTHRVLSAQESSKYRGRVIQRMSSSTTITFVAGVGSTVFASLTTSLVSDDKWEIDHVFVEADAREVGLGDALMTSCLAHLSSLDAQWVGAQAQPGDRAMKNLFERHGLVAQTILVGKSLNDLSTEADASQ